MMSEEIENIKTSVDHPLNVNEIALNNGAKIGMTLCPDKKQTGGNSGNWNRDLFTDLVALKNWDADMVVSILGPAEMQDLQVSPLGEQIRDYAMGWVYISMKDNTVPDDLVMRQWEYQKKKVHKILDDGGKVVIHCRGGLGRTATFAAMILMERGMDADIAIDLIQEARPKTFPNKAQKEFVQNYHPKEKSRHGPGF